MSPGLDRHASRARRAGCWLSVVLGLAGIPVLEARAESPRPAIEGLRLEHGDAGIRVSFRLTGAFNEDVLERVHSGMRLSFEHKIVLLGRRIVPLFPRVTLARTVVVTTVQYDSLTRRYDLERRTVAQDWPEETPPERIEQRATQSREEMEAWMSEVAGVALPDPPDDRDDPLKIRVRTDLGMRFLLMFLPWPNTVTVEDWLPAGSGAAE